MHIFKDFTLAKNSFNEAPAVAPRETEMQSFVLRVWYEHTSEDGTEGEWRGHITDAIGIDRYHFRSLSDMIRFIEQRLGVSETSAGDYSQVTTPSESGA